MARPMVPAGVIQALVVMSPRTQRNLAQKIGMDPGNFSTALKGVRPIPDAPLQRLLAELGIDDRGMLRPDRVHLWHLGARVEPLRVAAEYLFPEGGNYAGLWRAGGGRLDIRRFQDSALVAITDGEARVVLRSVGIGMYLDPDPVNSTTVPALRHRLLPRGGETRMLSIPTGRFREWELGRITPDEFDAVLQTARAEPAVKVRRR